MKFILLQLSYLVLSSTTIKNRSLVTIIIAAAITQINVCSCGHLRQNYPLKKGYL